jgi:molybdate transport system substrate-binding protein
VVKGIELQVLAGGAMRVPLEALAESYARESGVVVAYQFGTTPELINLIAKTPFDFAIVPNDVLNDRAARSELAHATIVDLAFVGLGLAVPKGAPQADISTPAALNDLLTSVHSIAIIPQSAAGYQAARIFAALGIDQAIQQKLVVKKAPGEIVAALIANEVELGIFFSNVFMTPDVDLIHHFPAELQQKVAFKAGVSRHTKQAGAAEAFKAFLRSGYGTEVIAASGMEPAE